jgi:ribosomal protein S18 acetylase RimI-like enzyme
MSSANRIQENDRIARNCDEIISHLPTSTRDHPVGHVDPSLLTDRDLGDGRASGSGMRMRTGNAHGPTRHQPLEGRFPVGSTEQPLRRLDRKMMLLTRSGLFGSDTRGARITRAATVEDLRDAYRLVHDVYLGAEYISGEPAKMRVRIFETSPKTATFVARVKGKVVGVLSIIHDSERSGLPSEKAFAEEVGTRRALGLKLVEVTNQAVAPEYRRTGVPTELMRCAFAHAMNEGADQGIAAVSPSHNAFYELLGFRQIGRERSYSDKMHDPVVPVMIDLNKHRNPRRRMSRVQKFMHNYLAAHNPYFGYVGAWALTARDLFLDHGLLSKLFVEERNFLSECSADEKQALHEHWGKDLFAQVAGELFVPLIEEAEPPTGCGQANHESSAKRRDTGVKDFLDGLRDTQLPSNRPPSASVPGAPKFRVVRKERAAPKSPRPHHTAKGGGDSPCVKNTRLPARPRSPLTSRERRSEKTHFGGKTLRAA